MKKKRNDHKGSDKEEKKRMKNQSMSLENMSWKQRVMIAIKKATRSIGFSSPILLSVVILISTAQEIIPKESYQKLFSGTIIDPIIASGLGSIMAGNPITSYVIGGELLKAGITLTTVTAFIVAWVTVGIVQLPAEMTMLGKKYAITRNIVAFISAIIVAIITTTILQLL